MSVDGVSISNDGTIAFGTGERISCKWLITKRFKGDTCKLQILRDGSEQEVELVLRDGHVLRPRHPPTKTLEGQYVAFAGLVFSSMTDVFMEDLWDQNVGAWYWGGGGLLSAAVGLA